MHAALLSPCQSALYTLYARTLFRSQIFLAYTEKYASPAQAFVDGMGHERTHGRKTAPHSFPRKGALLSWAGFEAACQDFNIVPIATVKPSVATTAATVHHRALAQQNHRRQHHPRNTSLDHQRAPKTTPVPSASKTDSQLDSPTTTSGLLSGVQACIAFLSACTLGSVVASFPNDNGIGGFGGERAKRAPHGFSRGGSAAEDERICGDENGSAYWRVSVGGQGVVGERVWACRLYLKSSWFHIRVLYMPWLVHRCERLLHLLDTSNVVNARVETLPRIEKIALEHLFYSSLGWPTLGPIPISRHSFLAVCR